jgi:hypothetical protein
MANSVADEKQNGRQMKAQDTSGVAVEPFQTLVK